MGEFVSISRHLILGDCFIYSHHLNVWTSSDHVRRNFIFDTVMAYIKGNWICCFSLQMCAIIYWSVLHHDRKKTRRVGGAASTHKCWLIPWYVSSQGGEGVKDLCYWSTRQISDLKRCFSEPGSWERPCEGKFLKSRNSLCGVDFVMWFWISISSSFSVFENNFPNFLFHCFSKPKQPTSNKVVGLSCLYTACRKDF